MAHLSWTVQHPNKHKALAWGFVQHTFNCEPYSNRRRTSCIGSSTYVTSIILANKTRHLQHTMHNRMPHGNISILLSPRYHRLRYTACVTLESNIWVWYANYRLRPRRYYGYNWKKKANDKKVTSFNLITFFMWPIKVQVYHKLWLERNLRWSLHHC